MKNFKSIIIGIILVILLIIALPLIINSNSPVGEIPKDFVISDESDLQILYFNVGNADSILIKDDMDIMLIDAGNEPDGVYLSQYIKELGINKINYLIGTHEHEDHVGGMDHIVNNFAVDNIYLPNILKSETKTYPDYEEVIDVAKEKGITITNPKEEDVFYIGDSVCTIKYVGDKESNPNDNSIVIELKSNNKTYLFTGDIEGKIEKNVTWEDIDVLKVPHHGSDTSTSIEFLKQTKPDITIISTGTRANLLDDVILQRLQEIKNNKIYITRDIGTVYITNNGENIVKTLKTKVDSAQH
jgi:competence protein ComEC